MTLEKEERKGGKVRPTGVSEEAQTPRDPAVISDY